MAYVVIKLLDSSRVLNVDIFQCINGDIFRFGVTKIFNGTKMWWGESNVIFLEVDRSFHVVC